MVVTVEQHACTTDPHQPIREWEDFDMHLILPDLEEIDINRCTTSSNWKIERESTTNLMSGDLLMSELKCLIYIP